MTQPAKVALVTARPRLEVHADLDMELLRGAVAGCGADVSVTHWDDPAVDWASFDLAVIRSTWDYSWRPREFFTWLDQCSRLTHVLNPPHIMRWNAGKASYLSFLAARSVPVIPLTAVVPGQQASLPEYEFVVKPSIGAGSRYCARYAPGRHQRPHPAEEHIRQIHADGTIAIIQPYLSEIDTTGERALVFIRGEFLHAIRKDGVLAPGVPFHRDKDAHPGTRPWVPSSAELELATKALAAIPFSDRLLYARADMTGDPSQPVLTELELIEPGLYLRSHPGSEATVARAIVSAAGDASQR